MKKIIGVFIVGILVIASIACGQKDNPTISEIQQDLKLVELKLPNDKTILCIHFSRRGNGGYSWFALDCDWDSVR